MNKKLAVAWGLIIFGSILAIAAGIMVWHQHSLPKPPPGTVQTASPKPTEAEINNYTVPPDNPKYIAIPTIGVSPARVIRLGLLSNKSIATPDNVYDTGWYDGSAKPGQSGAMFIYGHVSSWTAKGVFYNLKKLEPGDKVIITRGDNKKFTYEVVSSKVYNYKHVNMRAALSPIDPSKPGLNLMTCTGQVIKGTSEFNERLVVFASLVKN